MPRRKSPSLSRKVSRRPKRTAGRKRVAARSRAKPATAGKREVLFPISYGRIAVRFSVIMAISLTLLAIGIATMTVAGAEHARLARHSAWTPPSPPPNP